MPQRKSRWPVLKHYDPNHLARIAMPLGGIGCGSVSIGGHGELKDWELFNRPSKGFIPCSFDLGPSVLIYTKQAGKEAQIRAAEGPLEFEEYEGCAGSVRPNHGMPRFRESTFDCAYPLGQVHLRDKNSPLDVRLEAFSPVIPGDADNSSLPVIQLRYVLKNKTNKPVKTAVIANLPNFIGMDPKTREVGGDGKYYYKGASKNKNTFIKDKKTQGIYMTSEGVDKNCERWGTLALTTNAAADVSCRTCWLEQKYIVPLVDFHNDLMEDGRLDDREPKGNDLPTGSLAVHVNIPANSEKDVVFHLTWHFPNRKAWSLKHKDKQVGNWYTTQFKDAWDAATRIAPKMPKLEEQTVRFVTAFCKGDLPDAVKEAMLFNLSTLFTETCHRLPDGTFCGWEGCGENSGFCEGSCTHVWNYEQALAFLFGDLAKTMREMEYTIAMGKKGDMFFRISQPYDSAPREFKTAAADGQMGCIMKIFRDWHLSGDTEMLKRLWPNVRKSLEYCWIEGSWDADKDGVMEGCQHNTMDVEYYGPNPQMQIWYLGALRAAEEMARFLGEEDFADECRGLFKAGSRWTDDNLFNGDYYEHHYRMPKDTSKIPTEQRVFADKPLNDDHQLLDACLVDQLVGQFLAHVCGLGYLVKPAHIRKTLRSIMKFNTQKGFNDHFNVMRSYALGDETALLMSSYPRSPRPKIPFPYYTEIMTGFEYTAAIGMLYEGQEKNGLKCIENIRDRYDGLKRSPFSEAECGHHYARAMASWGAGLALTGFRFSAIDKQIVFKAQGGTFFWSTGYAWGTVTIKGNNAKLDCLFGKLPLKTIRLDGLGETALPREKTLKAGERLSVKIAVN
jgi:uncharacterized protein (DUF608 family)